MPCATPVSSTRGLVARARIMSPSERPPGSTPRISASNVSTESPANTVRTMAFWPGRTDEMGAVGTLGAGLAGAVQSSTIATTMGDLTRERLTAGDLTCRTLADRPELNTRGAALTFMGRMNSPFLNRLTQGPLLADGAMGTLLFARGIPFERCFDELNLTQPAIVEQIHREYLAAGAELIETNTFGANAVRLSSHALGEKARILARQGAKLARNAREVVGTPAFVAGSMGPLGQPLAPFGSVSPPTPK